MMIGYFSMASPPQNCEFTRSTLNNEWPKAWGGFDWVTCASCSGHERDGFVVKKTAPFLDSGVKTDEKTRGAANDDWLSVKRDAGLIRG